MVLPPKPYPSYLWVKDFAYFFDKVGEVKSPSSETKVFLEVQVKTRFFWRSKSGILLSHVHDESTYLRKTPKPKFVSPWLLFNIKYCDLCAEDVFGDCEIERILGWRIGYEFNDYTTYRFVNVLRRSMSLFCNEVAKKAAQDKPSVITVVAHLHTTTVLDLDGDSEAEKCIRDCRPSCLPEGCERRKRYYQVARQMEIQTRVFDKLFGCLSIREFGDGSVDNDDQGKICAVCLTEFEKGNDVLMMKPCKHIFHTRCIIPWFNKVNSCPECRSVIRPNLRKLVYNLSKSDCVAGLDPY